MAALLALLLLISLCPAALAAEKGTLSIGTLEELADFADRCASDAYSKDLTVVLTADIDAAGTEMAIPVFSGIFDGQGHRIYNLELTRSASGYGFFGQIQKGAVVRNLSLVGETAPEGTQSQVGGVAGINYGRIENCRYTGAVIGEDTVGGIVGRNEEGGVVADCTTAGVVRGKEFTGGIAGQNAGTLLRCANMAAVNTTLDEADISAADLENLENTMYSILKSEDVTKGEVTENAITSDTGGIAGYSTGIVQSCTNSGSVGYPHVGYNVGGVAGRQNGYMASCINHGTVQGRKDVGGIVGQMAPDITLQTSGASLDTLKDDLNSLQSLVDRMLDDAQATSDTVSARMDRISAYADDALDSAHSLSGRLGDFADDNIDTVNNLLLLAERYISKVSPITDGLSDASGSLADAVDDLRDLLDDWDGSSGDGKTLLTQLQNFCREASKACEDIESGAAALDRALALLGKGPAGPDTAQLKADTAALKQAVQTLEDTINRALEELNVGGTVTEGTRKELRDNVTAILDCQKAIVRDLADVITGTDFGALRDQNLETLRQIAKELHSAMDAFASAAGHMGKAMGYLGDALGTMKNLDIDTGKLDDALQSTADAAESLADAMDKASKWADDLSKEDPGDFSQLGTGFDEDSDALNTSLSGMNQELSALSHELSGSTTTLLADVRAVNNKLMDVMNQFVDLLDDALNTDGSDLIEDVSEESLQSAVRGKVLECENYGDVSADRNVGGVAGSMAIEYDLDPEDDLLPDGTGGARLTYQTRAILLSCDNYGTVKARKSCAGGVAGRMDLGTIYGSGGWGTVSSESGDYVGGVCGLSLSAVRKSYAKCSLSGRKYVGGIVGSGSRVSGCISMAEITDYTQQGGAIAGEITGEYSGNLFVSDDLAGVDRISFSGKADQVSYETLRQRTDLPDQFRRLTLSFQVDGRTLKKQLFNYGASFTEEDYPTVPEQEGSYVHWDKTDLKNLRFDTVVSGEYTPYVTTLGSAQQRTNQRPVLLVQGKFREGDALRVEDTSDQVSGNVVECWNVQIPDDGQASHTVRWLIPEDGAKRLAVYVDTGSGAQKAETEQNGSYLCFTMTGSGTVTVVSGNAAVRQLWIAAAIAALAAAVLLVLWRRRRRKKAAEPTARVRDTVKR